MSRSFKTLFILSLCFIMVISTSVTTGFAVQTNNTKNNSAVKLPTAKPLPTVTPQKSVTVQGTVKLSLIQSRHLTLTAKDNTLYNLIGNTAGLDKYINKQVIITGIVRTNVKSIGQPGIILEVKSFKPVVSIPTPTKISIPTPSKITTKIPSPTPPVITIIRGKLELSQIETKHYEILFNNTIYVLTGNITGIEKLVGQPVEVKGYAKPDEPNIIMRGVMFEVLSFSQGFIPSATPSNPNYIKLQGYIKIIRNDPTMNNPYRFLLSTEKAPYELLGNTQGLEKYEGQMVVVEGLYIETFAPTEYPMFEVVSYTVVVVPTITTAPKYDVLQGILRIEKPDPALNSVQPYTYQLEMGSYNILLLGNTVGMEKYDGQKVEVTGNYGVSSSVRSFNVISYKLIVVPTITTAPNYDVLQGILRIFKPDLTQNSIQPYTYQLEIGTYNVVLLGNTVGMEKYDGQKVEVTGTYGVTSSFRSFNVVSYKPLVEPSVTPVPNYDVLQGIVKTVNTILKDSLVPPTYQFELTTEKGVYGLIGNTAGMEKYDGQKIQVTGNYVMTLVATDRPMFSVVSYIPLMTPTPTPASKTHVIVSDKMLYYSDPTTSVTNNISGNCTMSWTEDTSSAFFKAKFTANSGILNTTYEYELVSAATCTSDSLTGLFNIKKNGEIVAKDIKGQLYGIGQPLGNYFKFYSEDFGWHMSAYITYRMDF